MALFDEYLGRLEALKHRNQSDNVISIVRELVLSIASAEVLYEHDVRRASRPDRRCYQPLNAKRKSSTKQR